MGTPVWSHHGIVCTGEGTRGLKLTFARGQDPRPIASSIPHGRSTRRAIDIHEGEKVDAGAFEDS